MILMASADPTRPMTAATTRCAQLDDSTLRILARRWQDSLLLSGPAAAPIEPSHARAAGERPPAPASRPDDGSHDQGWRDASSESSHRDDSDGSSARHLVTPFALTSHVMTATASDRSTAQQSMLAATTAGAVWPAPGSIARSAAIGSSAPEVTGVPIPEPAASSVRLSAGTTPSASRDAPIEAAEPSFDGSHQAGSTADEMIPVVPSESPALVHFERSAEGIRAYCRLSSDELNDADRLRRVLADEFAAHGDRLLSLHVNGHIAWQGAAPGRSGTGVILDA